MDVFRAGKRGYGSPMLLLIVADILAIFLSFSMAIWLRFASNRPGLDWFIEAMPYPASSFVFWVMVGMLAMGLYRVRQRPTTKEAVARVILAVVLGSLANILFFYMVPDFFVVGRGVMALAMLIACVMLAGIRLLMLRLIDDNPVKRRVLVVGAGDSASKISMLRRRSDRRRFEAVAYVALEGDRLRASELGIEPVVEEVEPGRENLFFSLDSGSPGRCLLLEGHTDVVSEGECGRWSVDPFGGELKEGRIYGRGSCDMKAGLAVALLTAAAFVALAGTGSSVVSWRLLARRWKPMISDIGAWNARLEAALSREAGGLPAPDGEPSSFELIAGWYEELPKWLKARRKGGMLREPGQWLLIFFAGYEAINLALGAASEMMHDDYKHAVGYLVVSAVLFGVAVAIYLRWRKTRNEEDNATVAEVNKRLQSLKAEMEKYLGGM